MKVGNRIYYNQNGRILWMTGESKGNVNPHLKDEVINYVDLEFGDKTLENSFKSHVDIKNKKIIIDEYINKIESEEERLRKQNKELENQLLISTNKETGGIL